MTSAYADGAPAGIGLGSAPGNPADLTGQPGPGANEPVPPRVWGSPPPRRVTDLVTERVSRIRSFEGRRGPISRRTIRLKYAAYLAAALLASGLTELATEGVRYASGGGRFMLVAITIIAATGAASTLVYVNLRAEIVEKVRHYVFGITIGPGLLTALLLRAVERWEYVNEGSLGATLQMALPAVFLATVALPAIVFVKELLGIRTLHRSKLDDQEAVLLWTRQDGLQR